MRTEFAKNMKIINELFAFCNLHGAHDFNLELKVLESETQFVVTASAVAVSEKEMEQLLKRLHVGRRREMEQNYWGAGGRSDTNSELLMVGMMIDEADVCYEDNVLTIKLIRHK